jgi:hypothetical protein
MITENDNEQFYKMISDFDVVSLYPVRGRPRIHPIKEIVEGPKKRGPPIKYNTIEEKKEAKKLLERKYYHQAPSEKIAKVRAYQALNVEFIKESRRLQYIKKRDNSKNIIAT